jgi:UDP-N-acetyl-D-glucosamine dehydrogenase
MPEAKNVSILGQGYVGLPLAYSLCEAGFQVLGLDIQQSRVDVLNSGKSPIEDLGDTEILEMLNSKKYLASTDLSAISNSQVIVLCVPTPLDESGAPDLASLRQAVEVVAKYAMSGALVINESTSYPGTVRGLIQGTFSKLRPNENFSFASAPERVDPGNLKWNQRNTPRLVGGLDATSLDRAVDFYSQICDSVIPVSSPEVAEFAKLLENSFRQVNIALVTELSRITSAVGVNIFEVIEAASSKPYGYMKFTPSAGVGGHCIPVDPMYLSWFARENGVVANLVELAQGINQGQPGHIANRVVELIGGKKGRVLIVGMGYKPQTSDLRHSPSVEIYNNLKELGFEVEWHDPFVATFDGKVSATQTLGFDLVIHAQLVSDKIIEEASLNGVKILDCTGALASRANVFLP